MTPIDAKRRNALMQTEPLDYQQSKSVQTQHMNQPTHHKSRQYHYRKEMHFEFCRISQHVVGIPFPQGTLTQFAVVPSSLSLTDCLKPREELDALL